MLIFFQCLKQDIFITGRKFSAWSRLNLKKRYYKFKYKLNLLYKFIKKSTKFNLSYKLNFVLKMSKDFCQKRSIYKRGASALSPSFKVSRNFRQLLRFGSKILNKGALIGSSSSKLLSFF